jgi:hypothetical protein
LPACAVAPNATSSNPTTRAPKGDRRAPSAER